MSPKLRRKLIRLFTTLLAAIALLAAIVVIIGILFIAFEPRDYLQGPDYEAWKRGCGIWRMRGCDIADINNIRIPGYDPYGDGNATLLTACQRVFGKDFSAHKCYIRCCEAIV